jgi:hypothetical protein
LNVESKQRVVVVLVVIITLVSTHQTPHRYQRAFALHVVA